MKKISLKYAGILGGLPVASAFGIFFFYENTENIFDQTLPIYTIQSLLITLLFILSLNDNILYNNIYISTYTN